MRVEATDEYQGVPPYYCPGCGEQMVAKTANHPNRRRRKHYAHKSRATTCSNESMLHADAKRLIAKSIRDEPAYWITVTCGNIEYTDAPCKNVLSRMNLAGADADTERFIVGNRADVLVRTQEGKEIIIAIEVVVHHETSPESRSRYEQSNIPVLFVRVESQEDILPLGKRIVVTLDDYIGQLPPCDACAERAKMKAENNVQEKEAERQRAVAERWRAIEEAAAERQRAREETERQQATAEAEAERQRIGEEARAGEFNAGIEERKQRLLKAYAELEKYQMSVGNASLAQYNKGKQECLSSNGARACGTPKRDCPLLLCNGRYFHDLA